MEIKIKIQPIQSRKPPVEKSATIARENDVVALTLLVDIDLLSINILKQHIIVGIMSLIVGEKRQEALAMLEPDLARVCDEFLDACAKPTCPTCGKSTTTSQLLQESVCWECAMP